MSSSTPSLTPCEYKTGKKLGEGSYSIVREATHTLTSKKYAVKIISKALMSGKEHMVINEIEVLKRVSHGHPNILTLYDYFETPNNLYLVMELCLGGELFDRIYDKGFYFEADAAHTLRLVLSALEYIHSQNIVHRDIKPENLIYKSASEDDLVLADFGLSRIVDADVLNPLQTRCGTPGYMAPEVLRRTPYGKPVDIWSVGVLAYFLLCGYTPFDGASPTDELKNIVLANYHYEPKESWSNISSLAKGFIDQCLKLDPTKRPTATQALAHPWLAKPEDTDVEAPVDLLPLLKKFNAKKTFIKAIGVVRAVNKFSHIGSNGHSRETSAENLLKIGEEMSGSSGDVSGSSCDLMVLVKPKPDVVANESLGDTIVCEDIDKLSIE